MRNLAETIKNLGFSAKAAVVYLAALELGEATVQQLAQKSGLRRTTIYYTLQELTERGALIAAKRHKRIFYLPETPARVLKTARERLNEFEETLPDLEEMRGKAFTRPRTYFLFGVEGFKKVWDAIFASKSKEYRIITQGENFLDYVKEKYILNEIIAMKKKLGIKSKQLIVDSAYAQRVADKDPKENRQTKFLPSSTKLPFTEIIADTLVAFISPRYENTILLIENESFARTRRSLFDIIWNVSY